MKTRNDFGHFVKEHYQTGSGAEIGTRFGLFAKTVGKVWPGRIICIDAWADEEIYEVATQLLADKKYHLHRGCSVRASQEYADEGLDWIYIDADHTYQSVKQDLEAWFPKVRKGGVLAGHDYVDYKDWGVKQAVDEFCKDHGYELQLTTDLWHGINFATWYFIK